VGKEAPVLHGVAKGRVGDVVGGDGDTVDFEQRLARRRRGLRADIELTVIQCIFAGQQSRELKILVHGAFVLGVVLGLQIRVN